MKLNSKAHVLVPDGIATKTAMKRITHIGISAHQDDLEIMCAHGILSCFNKRDEWFAGVVCTSGSGSSRLGPYANVTDAEMGLIRQKEQIKAAEIGEYGILVQLGYESAEIKTPAPSRLCDDLISILTSMSPTTLYTHNLADKHDTHVAVSIDTITALRSLSKAQRPEHIYGCEVWRGLEWLTDKIEFDVSGREHLLESLLGVYDSQIAGGKRYDLATIGRMRSNATFAESHKADRASHVWYAMDLRPLVDDGTMDIVDFVQTHTNAFFNDIKMKCHKKLGRGT